MSTIGDDHDLTQEEIDYVVDKLVEEPIQQKALADAVWKLDDTEAGAGEAPPGLEIQCVLCEQRIDPSTDDFGERLGMFVHKACHEEAEV